MTSGAQEKAGDANLFDTAQKAICQKQWAQAVDSLKKLEKNFPKSDYCCESLYWLSYSMNKLGDSIDDMNSRLEQKQKAVQNLGTLFKNYPKCVWVKDATILRIEIAEYLIKNGLG